MTTPSSDGGAMGGAAGGHAPGSTACPIPELIECMAHGDEVTPETAAHILACDRCRTRLQAARDDAAFVGRARNLVESDLGPPGAPAIPGYRVQGVISTGSQGVVYRAVQESTLRAVAIKTFSGLTDPRFDDGSKSGGTRRRLRAEREVEIIARLRHPNVVNVYESRTLWDGRLAVIMEFVDGVPLDRWAAGPDLTAAAPPSSPPADRRRAILRVMIQVCAAVHHAHLNGVIHRDLKPDNILVTTDATADTASSGRPNGHVRPVVLDFGIAKIEGLGVGGPTLTGDFAGTPAYASPEQVAGHPEDVDALTDVYSLGVILYRLLTGKMPYDLDGSIFDMARTITESEPAAPNALDPSIPRDLEAITLRALRKDKARRYQSAVAMGQDIERFLAGEPVEARSESGWYLLRKAVMLNRRRLLWAAAAASLALASLYAVVHSLTKAAESSRLAILRQDQFQAERVRARAVTELLRAVMPAPDPSRPDVADAVSEGLERLHSRLETNAFAADPQVDQEIRRLWGGVYTGSSGGSGRAASRIEYAEVSLRNGLTRLRLTRSGDHADVAATMHQLAGVVLLRKRLDEAERWSRDALAMRERLFGPASIPAAESRCLFARVLLAQGRTALAAQEADAVLDALAPPHGQESALLSASMQSLKARIAIDSGDPAQAADLTTSALRFRLAILPSDDLELIASLNDAADCLPLAPDSPLAAILRRAFPVPDGVADDKAIAAVIRADTTLLPMPDRLGELPAVRTGKADALGHLLILQESLLTPRHPAVVGTLLAQVRAATSEAMLELRAEAAIRAADLLTEQSGRDDFSVLHCVEQAASALIFCEQPDRAVDLSRRSCEIWATIPEDARDHLLAANSRRFLGWCLALADRHEEAIVEYRVAADQFLALVGPEHHAYALVRSNLAYSLACLGRLPEADDLSADALALAQRLPSTAPDQMSHIRLARAHVLMLLGRHADALPLLELVWTGYYGWTPGLRWHHVMVADAIACAEAIGDVQRAALWRSRVPARHTTRP